VKNDYIQLQSLKANEDESGYSIAGVANAGIDGNKAFTCQFDKKGGFTNLVPDAK